MTKSPPLTTKNSYRFEKKNFYFRRRAVSPLGEARIGSFRDLTLFHPHGVEFPWATDCARGNEFQGFLMDFQEGFLPGGLFSDAPLPGATFVSSRVEGFSIHPLLAPHADPSPDPSSRNRVTRNF